MSSQKFKDSFVTAKGETRAHVELKELETLWFNTGTQCNLSCDNCYIESSPKNDRLSLITLEDVKPYLKEIKDNNWPTKEIGLTGGEPFLNTQIISIVECCLEHGFQTIVLTNAYLLMSRYKDEILRLSNQYGDLLKIRVSLDHYTQEGHENERGAKTFNATLKNIQWLFRNNISLAIAGRSLKEENFEASKKGYKDLLTQWEVFLDFEDSDALTVFPEMDAQKDVPEITTDCWGILNKSPDDMMCSNSRMIVKRKGEEKAKVLACTLLAYDKQFELGSSLSESKKSVQLNHPFCAQFCVLGGASCS